jgi:acetylornithine deacetylase
MVTMLQELERQWGQSKSHPLFKPGWFSLHPGVFIGAPEGIMVPFMISTSCTIDYSVLYPPNETVEEIKSEIEGFVMQACQLDPWLRKHPPEIEYQLHWPPFATSVDDPIVDTTVGAFRRAANLSPDEDPERVTGFGAVCDVTYFREAGIPAVVYGGGPPQKGHTANEHTETDRVLMAAKTYALAAMDWCGVPTTG